jgi:hypothetical protein
MFPLELVHQVIDELGEAHRRNLGYSSVHSGDGYKALKACSLVSKRWISHSRAHMFKYVKIEEYEDQPAITPPASILPYVKVVKIYYHYRPSQGPSTPDLLKAFATAQIQYLGITGAVLSDKRACIQEFIETHSATLQTVKFDSCSLSAYNIADIVLGHHRLRRLRLNYCECEPLPPPRRPLVTDAPDPDTRSKAVELELRLSGSDPEEGPVDIIAMVARLPYRFGKLDVEHVAASYGATQAMNALIKANADVLSSLRVRIWAGMFVSLSRKMILLIGIQLHRRHGG